MKKQIPFSIYSLVAAFIFSTSLFAQEKTEITIKVKEDGKVVKDTTYQFEDAAEAKHVVFISEDGKTKEIKEFHGDSLIWITEEEVEGDHVKIIKKKMVSGDHPHGEKVVVIKKGDGETMDIFIDEESEGEENVKMKRVEVMVSGDEDGTWHVDSKELKDVEEDVYVISGDDVEGELKEILEDSEGENVKVIVVKKKSKKQ
ncbi:MAG: hypothetical protein ABFS38_04760 [Bacteroidota bacterium]